LVALAAGLAASFFVAATLFVVVFLAAALALVVDEVPVADFLAAPRLEGAVVFLVAVVVLDLGLVTGFLATGFFTAGLVFSVSTFFTGAFLVVEDLGLVVAAFVALVLDVGFAAAADLGFVVGFAAGLEVGLAVDLVGLFSLAAVSVDLVLGANLTLPEGPEYKDDQ